jgi:hypothetical protein
MGGSLGGSVIDWSSGVEVGSGSHARGVELSELVNGEIAKLVHAKAVAVVLAVVLLDEVVVVAPHVPAEDELLGGVGLGVGPHPVREGTPERVVMLLIRRGSNDKKEEDCSEGEKRGTHGRGGKKRPGEGVMFQAQCIINETTNGMLGLLRIMRP